MDLRLQLDDHSAIPAGEQIASQLIGLIRIGDLADNDALPSIRQMSSSLGVATGTVRHAYDMLANRGLIVTAPGKAARVARHGRASCDVLAAAQCLIEAAHREGVDLTSITSIITASWDIETVPAK